ncbi:hypothetical protein Lal_00040381 [Lupinus albus]|nr:hypothetical protein Lal_00040381 [Lupinus albus]
MATIVATIEYLVHEILLRLPVKSLLRFKCVSKQWLALISEPNFCHSHTLRLYISSRVFPSSFLLAPVDSPNCQVISLKTINVSHSFKFHNVKIPRGTVIQSCNEFEYFVCNPTTNKFVPVIFPTQQFSDSVLSLFICFEPLKSRYYKLVSFRFNKSCRDMGNILSYEMIIDRGYVINVYSSETSSWSESGFTFSSPIGVIPVQPYSVYFNGSLYWHDYDLRKTQSTSSPQV